MDAFVAWLGRRGERDPRRGDSAWRKYRPRGWSHGCGVVRRAAVRRDARPPSPAWRSTCGNA